MKKLILVFILIGLSSSVKAQNVTMAKAFYKKAQKEYENKNYREVISLLAKTVENLNGEKNPDIIYLEAKSRYSYDLNINKTKALFNQFLKEADQNDDRINDASGILVEIETSDNYYDNGQIKVFRGLTSSKRPYSKHYSQCYSDSNSYTLVYEETEKKYEYREYVIGGIKMFGELLSNNEVIGQYLYKDNSTNMNLIMTRFCYIKDGDNSDTVMLELPVGGGRNCQDSKSYVAFNIPSINSGYTYYDDEGENKIQEYDGVKKSLLVYSNNNIILEIDNVVTEYTQHYPFPQDILGAEKYFSKGRIKEIKANRYAFNDKEYYIYYFSEAGLPIKKEYYVRNKIKAVNKFDSINKTWSNLKKKDW